MGLENEVIISIPVQFHCKGAEDSICQVTLQIVQRFFPSGVGLTTRTFMTTLKVRT